MCLTHFARRTKTCIAFVGPWWIKAGEDDLFIPPKRFGLSWTVIPSSIYVFQTAKPKPAFSGIVGQSDRDTLLLIICTHISPGTRVMSDMWKAYEGYTYLTVNHSQNFVDPADTGAHTQRNENTWCQTKYASYRNIQRSLRKLSTGMVVVVASALWRRSFCQNIIKHIADLYA